MSQPTSTMFVFLGSAIRIPLFAVLAAIAVVATAASASADSVVLRNGDRLTGTVVSSSATDLVIDTELAGRVTVKRSDVSEVTSSPQAASPAAIAPWNGAVTVGLDVSRGNSETENIATVGKITRLGRRDRLGFFGTYL